VGLGRQIKIAGVSAGLVLREKDGQAACGVTLAGLPSMVINYRTAALPSVRRRARQHAGYSPK